MLLESGGLDYEAATADLNAGENAGEDYYALEDSRLRFFGGTTAIWGGRCAELDPIDLEPRDWVPHSGWPIALGRAASAGIDEARPLFGLPAAPARTGRSSRGRGAAARASTGQLETPLWTFDRRFNRFAWESCADLDGRSAMPDRHSTRR